MFMAFDRRALSHVLFESFHMLTLYRHWSQPRPEDLKILLRSLVVVFMSVK